MRTIPLAVVVGLLVVAMPSAQEPSQATLVFALQNGPESGRAAAIEAIKAIPVEQRQPSLLTAVINEASRLAQDLKQRRLELADTGTVRPSDEGEYLFRVLDTLADYPDVVVIKPLLTFVSTGTRVMDAVADFGEDAVFDVLALSQPGEADEGDALLILQKFLERPSLRKPLSADSKRRILEVANTHLHTGNQKDWVVAAAIRLAVATGDATLLDIVRRLASDDLAAQELGALDDHSIKYIHAMAASTLKARGIK